MSARRAARGASGARAARLAEHRPSTTSSSVDHSPCGLDLDLEGQARPCRPSPAALAEIIVARDERLALVAEHAAAPCSTLRRVLALLRERVLDLEQVGEVACRLRPAPSARPASRRGSGSSAPRGSRSRRRAAGSPRASSRRRRCRFPARGRSASRSTGGRRPRARSAARRSTVSTHFERNRVSNENSPVGSVERRLDVAARRR